MTLSRPLLRHCKEFYCGEVPDNVNRWKRIFSSVLWQSNGSGIWQYNHGNPHNAMSCLMHLLMGCTPTMHCFKTITSRQSISPIDGKGISELLHGIVMIECEINFLFFSGYQWFCTTGYSNVWSMVIHATYNNGIKVPHHCLERGKSNGGRLPFHYSDAMMSTVASPADHQPHDCLLNRLFRRSS